MATTTTRLALTKPAGTDVVDIDVLNANSDKIDAAVGAFNCTSTTRPASPYAGQLIYETDTTYHYVYSGGWKLLNPIQSTNYLINGAMDIWQRGTSSSAAGYQTADRWFGNASATTTFAQETSNVPTGFRYAYKMTLGATTACYVEQAIETSNAINLAGKTATLSAYIAGSSTQSVALNVYYSTSVDVGPGGAWTLAGTSIVSIGTTWSRYSSTVSIPAGAKSLKASFVQQGSNVSGTVLYITGAQLEEGAVVTPFHRAGGTIQGELAACNRYYVRWSGDGFQRYFALNGAGNATASTNAFFTVFHPVKMRVTPSGTPEFSNIGFSPWGTPNGPITGATILTDQTNQNASLIQFTGSSFPIGFGSVSGNNSLTSYFALSAEL